MDLELVRELILVEEVINKVNIERFLIISNLNASNCGFFYIEKISFWKSR